MFKRGGVKILGTIYDERNVEAIAMIKEITGEEEGNFKISLRCMDHSSCHLKSANEVFVIVR